MGSVDRRSALRLSAFAGLGVALGACASGTRDEKTGTGAPDRLMFIRHGEEPGAHGGPYGVTLAGEGDPRSLSVLGWTRAGALATLFDPRDADGKRVPTRPDLARPTTIFAPDPGETRSRRSLETVTPLAAALGLEVDTRFAASQTAQIADALRAVAGTVLIAWKHEQIVDIITQFTGGRPTAPPWPARRYDLAYVLTRIGADWQFTQVAQMLLAGDLQATAG